MSFLQRLLSLTTGMILFWPVLLYAEGTLNYRGEQTLFVDTVWDGDILVDGILTVAPGVTLEIRPGTRVRISRFDSNGDGVGEHEIFSQGTIRALGTAAAPILFTSAESDPQQGDWGAVNMMVSEEDNLLAHVVVEYGYRGFHAHFSRARLSDSTFRSNLRGAQFQESTVTIERCRFDGNTNGVQFRDSTVELVETLIAGNHWGLRCVYSKIRLSGCEVRDNLVNGVNIRDGEVIAVGNRIVGNRRGLYLQRSSGEVQGNLLAENSEHGIFLEDSDAVIVDNRITGNGRAGVRWLNGSGRLARNRIEANGEYGLVNDGESLVVARHNWWGTTEKDKILAAVRDGNDRVDVGMTDLRYPLMIPMPDSVPVSQEL